ncbi:MAG: LysM peptidoglycan-binding domain-containing protein [Bacteroidales bacterium]|nr:LysM peptidoglycan-binding domain-containing protein [Bacteroidales bacterium]
MEVKVTGNKASITGVADGLATKEKVILAAGNIKGISEVEDLMTIGDAKKEEVIQGEIKIIGNSKFYTVKKGDSLSKISKAMYGDPMKYNSIFEANKPMLKNVDLI